MYKVIGTDGKEYGPITAEVLKSWVAEGRANGKTKVLPEGASDWKSLEEIPELWSPPAAPPPRPVPGPVPGPISIAPTPRNNPYAVASLCLGAFSLTAGLCCCYGVPFSVPGIVCSIVALNQIKTQPDIQQGKGMAIGGLLLSILGLLAGVILLVVGVALGTPDLMKRIHRL